VEDAFRLFTESFGDWWPGDESEQEAMREGAVTVWDPPHRIGFVWQRQGSETVDLEFQAEGAGTRLIVTHTGWERAASPVCLSAMALAA
jgi:hypothetical protein